MLDLRAYQDEKSKKNAEISPVGAVIMNVFGGMGRTADALKITYGYLTGDPVVRMILGCPLPQPTRS